MKGVSSGSGSTSIEQTWQTRDKYKCNAQTHDQDCSVMFMVAMWCQNPLFGNVLGSIPPCIHQRNHNGIQIQIQMGEGTPPDELIQMARNKSSPKILV